MLQTTITLIAAIFAIWSIIDVARSRIDTLSKVGWFAIVILIPILGPLIYYVVARYNADGSSNE